MAAAAFEPLEAARQPGRDKIADRLINIDENVIYRCSERPPAIASVAVRASIRFNELLFHRWPSVYPHPRLPTRNVEEPGFLGSSAEIRDYVFPKRRICTEPGMLKPLEFLLFPARLLRGLLRRLGRRRRRTREHLSQSVLKSKTMRFDGYGFHFTCHDFTTFLSPSKPKSQNWVAMNNENYNLPAPVPTSDLMPCRLTYHRFIADVWVNKKRFLDVSSG